MYVRGSTIHADAVDDDMYAAIDALADKLDSVACASTRNASAITTRRDAQKHGLAVAPADRCD